MISSFHFEWGYCGDTFEERPLYFKRPNGTIVSYEALVGAKDYYCQLYPILSKSGLNPEVDTADRVAGDRMGLLAVAVAKLPGVPWPDLRYRTMYDEALARVATLSQHLGTPKSRQEFSLTYQGSSDPIDTDYGQSWCHRFLANGKDQVIWWTGKPCRMIVGETRVVKATVTAHESFRGATVTKVSRVNVPKGEPPIVESEEETQ